MSGTKKKYYLPDREDALRYGFEFPGESRIVVLRAATHMHRGHEWRVITIYTERETLEVYVTPTGLTRVFNHKGKELKQT